MDASALKGQYLSVLGIQAYAWRPADPQPEADTSTNAVDSVQAPVHVPSPDTIGEPPARPANLAPTPRAHNSTIPANPAITTYAPQQPTTAPQTTPSTPTSLPKPPPVPEPITAFDPPSWAPPDLPQFDRNLPRFTLCFSQFGERLLVIYDASRHRHTVDAADQQLLARVSFALWQEQLSSKVNAFIWPQLPATAKIDLSIRVARSAVQAYFQQRRAKSQVQSILILGRVPACYLLSLEQLQQDFASLRGQRQQIANSTVVVSEDMQLLQSQPSSKRQAWQEMQLLLPN